MGPARSPTALLTPSPFSANVDAHCPTACSEAPAQTIMSMKIQNILLRKSPEKPIPSSPLPGRVYIGATAKITRLNTGTAAHASASSFQLSVPNSAKNTVETSTTPTCPQQ